MCTLLVVCLAGLEDEIIDDIKRHINSNSSGNSSGNSCSAGRCGSNSSSSCSSSRNNNSESVNNRSIAFEVLASSNADYMSIINNNNSNNSTTYREYKGCIVINGKKLYQGEAGCGKILIHNVTDYSFINNIRSVQHWFIYVTHSYNIHSSQQHGRESIQAALRGVVRTTSSRTDIGDIEVQGITGEVGRHDGDSGDSGDNVRVDLKQCAIYWKEAMKVVKRAAMTDETVKYHHDIIKQHSIISNDSNDHSSNHHLPKHNYFISTNPTFTNHDRDTDDISCNHHSIHSFCVRTIRDGSHDYTSLLINQYIAEVVIEETQWTVDLVNMDIEVIAILLNSFLVIGLNIPTFSPPFLKSRFPGETRPPVLPHCSAVPKMLRPSTGMVKF